MLNIHLFFFRSSPRIYCALLGCSLVAQERLNRITQFVTEMTLTGSIPSIPKLDDQMSSNANTPDREPLSDWMASAIPVDGAAVISAAAAGIISDDEIPQFSVNIRDSHCQSPVSVAASDASDSCQFRDIDKDVQKIMQDRDSCAFETPGNHDSMERIHVNCGTGQISLQVGTPLSDRCHVFESLGSSELPFR